MKQLFLSFMLVFLTLSFCSVDAYAKRFGGGRSFGINRTINQTSSSASRMQPMGAKPASAANKWMGPLAGLALGGMLAYLFMGHGIGAGILSWLLVGGVIFLIFGFIRSRMQPRVQWQPVKDNVQSFTSNETISAAQKQQRPAGFDEEDFLRQTKATFLRLQNDFDHKNLSDIREFTTPEVFAEIQLQIQERGDEINQTEVISIQAELLDINMTSPTKMAAVAFSGLVRETAGAEPIQIKEIWHFQKNVFNQNWIVAGVQQ